MPGPALQGVGRTRSGRERLLTAAYELFSRSGIRAVGVDAITDHADVAKMTLYRNFKGKNELAQAFLELREQRWLTDWVRAETQARAASPALRLLAIFDIFTEWFGREDFEGCPFVTSLLEFDDRDDPVRQACVKHLASVRAYLCELAAEAGAEDPERFAAQWHILVHGSIVAAHEGDLDAAMKARELGVLMLDREHLADLEPIGRGDRLAPAEAGPDGTAAAGRRARRRGRGDPQPLAGRDARRAARSALAVGLLGELVLQVRGLVGAALRRALLGLAGRLLGVRALLVLTLGLPQAQLLGRRVIAVGRGHRPQGIRDGCGHAERRRRRRVAASPGSPVAVGGDLDAGPHRHVGSEAGSVIAGMSHRDS